MYSQEVLLENEKYEVSIWTGLSSSEYLSTEGKFQLFSLGSIYLLPQFLPNTKQKSHDPTFISNYHAMYIFSFTAKLPDVSPLAVSSSLHFQKRMNLHLLRLSATAAGAVQLYS